MVAKFFVNLKKAGIGVQIHYIPIHLQPYYRDKFGYKEGDFPEAEEYYSRTVSLPLYPALTREDISRIVEQMRIALG